MVRRLKRLLISAAFVSTLAAASPVAFADSNHGNSASAPGHEKNSTSQTSPSGTQSKQAAQETTAQSSGSSTHSTGNAGTSGTYNQPQPYSKADRNNTGANDTSSSNPYKSTRNGSPSMNGNGGGQATGKPCAGCVGKADNKNPKGQYPNGSDHNKGYECDKNHGIGKGNPAHTGCTGTPGCTSNCGGMGGCTENCDTDHGCKTDCNHHKPCKHEDNHKPCRHQEHHKKPCPPPVQHHKPCLHKEHRHKPCVPVPTTAPPTGGRGGNEEVPATTITGGKGAAETTSAVVSNALPNTGLSDSISWWSIAAIISFAIASVYWRQFIAPLLENK